MSYIIVDLDGTLILENDAPNQPLIDHLNDPDKIRLTHNQVLPNFILQSIAKINYPYSLS